jgi:protein TonB
MRPPARKLPLYALSAALHLGGGAWLSAIEIRRPPEPVVVEMRTVEKPRPVKVAPPPPEPPKPELAPKPSPPKLAPSPPKAAPAPPKSAAPAAAVHDFGLALTGGPGGPGGIAVPVGGGPAPAAPKVQQAAKTLTAAAQPAAAGCDEADTKAKPTHMPQPAYTDEARAAQVEGKVRVELSIDATGKVVKAAVVSSLGHGLDEAALTAVRAASFSPATRCGEPVPSTFVIAVRFAL